MSVVIGGNLDNFKVVDNDGEYLTIKDFDKNSYETKSRIDVIEEVMALLSGDPLNINRLRTAYLMNKYFGVESDLLDGVIGDMLLANKNSVRNVLVNSLFLEE